MIYELCSFMTVASAAVAFVMMIRMAAKEAPTEQYGAVYALARSLVLLIVAVIPLIVHSLELAMLMSALMIVVQTADAYVAAMSKHRLMMVLSAMIAAGHLVLLVLLAC